MRRQNTKTQSHWSQQWYQLQKRCHNASGFTFVELIVVVTIIAILSVSAWTNLTGETESARDARRVSDLTSLQGALERYYIDNSFFPQPAPREDGESFIVDSNQQNSGFFASIFNFTVNAQEEIKANAWGYRPNADALASCTIDFDETNEVVNFDGTVCGGDIRDIEGNVIGWKGTLTEKSGKNSVAVAKGESDEIVKNFGPEYVPTIQKDPKLSGNEALAGVGADMYVYAVYRGTLAGKDNKNGAIQYQLATALEGESPDERKTLIVGNYTQKRGKGQDPHSLIGSGDNVLIDTQLIGQDNPKVANKSTKEIESAITSKVDAFKDEIEFLKENTTISDDAQEKLEEAETKMENVEESIEAEDFESAELDLEEVREDIRDALNQFYSDAASTIANNVEQSVESDDAEQIKEDALKKIEDIDDVRSEIEQFARNNRSFDDLREEFDTRKEIETKLTLLNDELEELENILQGGDNDTEEIIDEDLAESLFKVRNDGFNSDTRASNDDDNEENESNTGSIDRVSREIEDFVDEIEKIKADLFEVDKDKQEFSETFGDIITAIDELDQNVKDLEEEIERASDVKITQDELESFKDEFDATQNAFERLKLALEIESKLTGNSVQEVTLVFNEKLLGSQAGQAGVVNSISPLSDYTGIPVPLDLGT